MTTETMEAPAGVTLVGARSKAKASGIPTSGIILLVGHPKSGKSTLAASFPDSYVLNLERDRADRIPFGRIHDVNDLEAFGNVLQAVIAADDIKTIVIDTIDELAKMMQDDIAKAAGVEFLGKVEKGVDNRALWGEFAQRGRGMVDYLKSSNKLVVINAHCKAPEKDDQGRVITPAGINVSGKTAEYLAGQALMIGYTGVRVIAGKAQHYLSFKAPSDLAIWRSGVDELNDQEIVLSKTNPYESFAAAFGKTETQTAPVALKQPTKTHAGKRK